MHYASAMAKRQLCIVQKLYLKSVRGCAQCSVAGHQEVLAHTVTIHRRHPLRPTFYLQGGQGAVGVRLSGGAPLGGRCATGGVGAGASGDRPGGR